MVVAGGERHEQGCQRLRQRPVVQFRIRAQDASDTGDPGGRFGNAADRGAGHQHMDLAQRRGGGDCGTRCRRDVAVHMVEQDESGHGQITFASVRSLATSSATEPTLIPA